MELKVDPEKIRQLRRDKSWSQEELAEKAAVSLRTVQRMELDGSASLKSRRAIADALEVEPSYLDPAIEAHSSAPDDENASTKEAEKGFWSDLFSYPGPKSVSSKIRTPLIVTLWAGMVDTGIPLLLTILGFAVLSLLNPGDMPTPILITSVPLFFVFVIFLCLFQFFRRVTSPPRKGQ